MREVKQHLIAKMNRTSCSHSPTADGCLLVSFTVSIEAVSQRQRTVARNRKEINLLSQGSSWGFGCT